ncbi:MAG: FAD-dependent oxidoreductase, partial [Acidimicrobiales bacterium]
TAAKEPPARLAVLGGGVAGCELSQAWASLGRAVTVLEMADHLLPAYEPVAGRLLADAMAEAGIDVRLGVTVTGAERRPDDLGLEHVGLEPGSWLTVDDTMAVEGVPGNWLYAAGDVNHRVLLTHQGKYQARICGDAIVARAAGRLDPAPWGPHAATADHRAVPQVVFTDPEIASVGLSEVEAAEAGVSVRVVDYPLGQVAGAALYADGYRGHARLVVDEDRRVVVGATFVGPDAGELLHAATIAVVGEVPLDRLWHAVPSYPTISEVWLRLLEAYGL